MDHHGAQIIQDVAFAMVATIQRLTFKSNPEDDLRPETLSEFSINRSLMEDELSLTMSDATEESLQPLSPHSYPDSDPTEYTGWEYSRFYPVHRSLLILSFYLRDIRVGNIGFDPGEMTERLRDTREVLDEANFNVSSYPLAYNGRIEFVRSSLQGILVSARLMRPPPQWLRRYLRNSGCHGLPPLKLVDFATIQEPECAICRVEYSQEPGDEIVHLPCDERHIFHAKCIGLWLKQHVSCPACRVKFK